MNRKQRRPSAWRVSAWWGFIATAGLVYFNWEPLWEATEHSMPGMLVGFLFLWGLFTVIYTIATAIIRQ